MSIETICNNLAVRVASLSGMKGAYSAVSTTTPSRYMPDSVDDWPIAIVWPDGGDLGAGNGPEPFMHQVEARIWVNAANTGAAFKLAWPFVELARVLFRTDVTLSGACTRCLFVGYGPIEADQAHGKPFYILPLRFEVLEHTATNAYSVSP